MLSMMAILSLANSIQNFRYRKKKVYFTVNKTLTIPDKYIKRLSTDFVTIVIEDKNQIKKFSIQRKRIPQDIDPATVEPIYVKEVVDSSILSLSQATYNSVGWLTNSTLL